MLFLSGYFCRTFYSVLSSMWAMQEMVIKMLIKVSCFLLLYEKLFITGLKFHMFSFVGFKPKLRLLFSTNAILNYFDKTS